jgi:dTDP-4-amino-4,6-dideoxygalactose transaminase
MGSKQVERNILNMPGPGMEFIGEEEIEEVVEVLRGGYIYRYDDGEDPRFKAKTLELEQAISQLAEVRHAVALNSGTSALLVALGALGVGPGDEVIVPGYTYIASISAIVYARAIPVLAEIDRTFDLDPKDVEAKITPRTKAIIAVHMIGNPARLDELKAVADKHGLALIEDCAQSFGASYKGRFTGSIGDIGTYSFNVYKTITAGDGGMVVTNNEELYTRSFAFHDQGHSPLRTGVEIGQRPFIGLDFRMTEIQAAVLLAQLRKLPQILAQLRANKKQYKEVIADLPGLEFREITDPEGECATVLTIILPTPQVAQKLAQELGNKVNDEWGWHVYNNMENILEQRTITPEQCPFTCPYYTNEAGQMQYRKGMLPQTDELLARSINISIGVSDPTRRSVVNVTVKDDLHVVKERAAKFCQVASKYLK